MYSSRKIARLISQLKVHHQDVTLLRSRLLLPTFVSNNYYRKHGTSPILIDSNLVPISQHTKPVYGKNKSDDAFILSISESKNVFEAIELFEKNYENLDDNQLIFAVSTLFTILRNEKNSKISRREVLNSVGIQKMMKALRQRSRHMDPGDLINCLKILVLLGVTGSDSTLQTILKLISKHANSLELNQIYYLHFLISKMNEETKSSLSTALEYALPVVFESQLENQVPYEQIQGLCDYLHYATKNSLSDRSIQVLVEAILKQIEKMNPRQSMSVFWSIADCKHNPAYQEPLINVCFKHITDSLDSFKLEEISTAIGKSAKKYLRKYTCFYNEDFMQAYCNKLMSRYVDPEHTLWSCKYVSLLRHLHVEYLDRLGELIITNRTEVLNNDFLFVNLVRCFAGSNYKPENWYKFEAMLLDHPALTKDLGMKDIGLALDFLSLGAYPEQMIHKIYSPEELPRLDVFLQRNTYNSAASLALLYNAVKIMYPDYTGPLPPLSMIEKWKEIVKHANSKKKYVLANSLRTGFGGESYVINGVYHDGIHIDHAIVMRKGGYPIAVNSGLPSQSNGLEDIKKPEESVIVLVKVFYKDAYSNNTNRLRGIPALEQKIIEQLGHPMISVDAERWLQQPDHEKIPYLMHRIREKIEKFQWNQSGSDVIPQ